MRVSRTKRECGTYLERKRVPGEVTETSYHNTTLRHHAYFCSTGLFTVAFRVIISFIPKTDLRQRGQQQVWGQHGEVWAPRSAFLRWAAGAQGRWKWMAEGALIQGADQPRPTRQRKGSQLKKRWPLQLPYSKRRVLFPTPLPGITKVPDHKSDLVRSVILRLKRSEGNNDGEEEGSPGEIMMEKRKQVQGK